MLCHLVSAESSDLNRPTALSPAGALSPSGRRWTAQVTLRCAFSFRDEMYVTNEIFPYIGIIARDPLDVAEVYRCLLTHSEEGKDPSLCPRTHLAPLLSNLSSLLQAEEEDGCMRGDDVT